MAEWERESFIDLDPDLRIRYCRSESPPPVRYAITLELVVDGKWTTIQLWDNADDVDEHHEHAYTRGEGKQRPTRLPHASVNRAMAAAIIKAKTEGPAIVRRWRDEE